MQPRSSLHCSLPGELQARPRDQRAALHSQMPATPFLATLAPLRRLTHQCRQQQTPLLQPPYGPAAQPRLQARRPDA